MSGTEKENPYDAKPELAYAWQAGWDAQKDGKPIPDAHLYGDSDFSEAWREGYQAASMDEIPPK